MSATVLIGETMCKQFGWRSETTILCKTDQADESTLLSVISAPIIVALTGAVGTSRCISSHVVTHVCTYVGALDQTHVATDVCAHVWIHVF